MDNQTDTNVQIKEKFNTKEAWVFLAGFIVGTLAAMFILLK